MPLHLISGTVLLILSSRLRLGLPSGLLPSGFTTKTLYASLLSPYVLLALSISVLLFLSPEQYLVKSAEHKAHRYVVFSTPLLHLVPRRPKYPPQHPIFENPQPTFLTQYGRPSFTPI
jgi:hypothetical protein